MYNPFSLQGKTILVTGASSGIGRSIAVESARMGAKVVVTGRHVERLNETFAALEGDGHLQFAADLADEDQRTELIGHMPHIDGVAFCAGIVQTVLFQFINRAKLDEVFEINFFSSAFGTTDCKKEIDRARWGDCMDFIH